MSVVPTYPNAVAPSPDPVLEKAKRDNPPSKEELAAEKALATAREAYDAFLRSAAKVTPDAALGYGDKAGYGFMSDSLRVAYEEANENLRRCLVRFNELRDARHKGIRAAVEAEERKAAEAWQREYARKHGQ